ncbi:relaxase/mobilization nuclease domain-containing protein [Ruminococcus sp. NK3A76]|uniref:relaxase/mobilization nuclease domain-containing protein n=1 Tax=Ruminococcus sp. NK3A76 TaxID=877411 RepID=UPI001FA7EE1F|nr:relaxase/mobilization nuclease domain-containing protein [Ruminococcus sp. NK3A76]
MPYCKSVAVHRNVKQALTYILNPDKTDERVLTISLNCMTEPDFAYTQMKAVYEQYARRSYDAPPSKSGKSPVKAIHYIMSFSDSENVTPELAHKIGMAFVRKMFGDDVQAVIATHVNTDHVHNHILINSYSLTGKRFYDNKASVRKMREVTNGVCRAFGITPALNFENEGRSLNYSEWQHKKNGTSWKEQIRKAIDSLIPSVSSFDDLLAELERLGFTIKRDKNILIKAPGQQRSVSLWKLGEDYTEESVNTRIGMIQVFAEPIKNQVDVYKLSEMLAVINKDHISSIGDLEGRILRLRKEYEKNKGEKCLKKLKEYLDIRDTYNEISRGDYISKLVEEERQRKENETQKTKKKPNKRR